MSRYGYDFSPAPSPTGWRSVFRNVLVIGTIAGISAVSGAVVALDLMGSGSAATNRPAVATQAQPVKIHVARTVTLPPSQPASAPTNAAAAQSPQATVAATTVAAAPAAQPATTPAPQALKVAPTPQPAPVAAAAVTVVEPKTAVPEKELTFSHGYARRRAVQTAATEGAGAKIEGARVESETKIGRASRAKAKTTVARQNGPQDLSGAYARVDQPKKSDFARHQALALGDSRGERRPQPQQGGLFGTGLFRGLF